MSDSFHLSCLQQHLSRPSLQLILNEHGDILDINKIGLRLLGFSFEEIVGNSLFTLIHKEDTVHVQEYFSTLQVQTSNSPSSITFRIMNQAGGYIWLQQYIRIIKDNKGRVYLLSSCHMENISVTQMYSKPNGDEAEQRYKSLFEQHVSAVISLNFDGRFLDMNQAAEQLLGYTRAELLQMNLLSLITVESRDAITSMVKAAANGTPQNTNIIIHKRSEQMLHLNITSIPIVMNNNVTGIYIIAADITDRIEYEKTIHKMAFYDALTGLPNRRLFQEYTAQTISSAQTEKLRFAILYMDLDRFKHINDSLGHSIGDMLLKEAANRLQSCLQKQYTVFRLGGDEFTVLIPQITEDSEAKEVAKVILQSFEQPLAVGEYNINITTSIGIALHPQDGEDMETLTKHADIAMYEAKQNGKNQYCLYSKHSKKLFSANHFLLAELYNSIKQGELTLLYQPIMHTVTKEIVSAEILVHWNHPKLGLISPNLFIPLAEETGFVTMIDEWVIQEACHQRQQWEKNGLNPLPISINVSTETLQHRIFPERVQHILEKYCIPPNQLTLEITRNIFQHKKTNALKNLEHLKQIGIQLAIDDFELSYPCLEYLEHISVNTIKIPKPFINSLSGSNYGTIVVSSLLSIAKQLHLHVIAGGVETKEQLRYLEDHECPFMQGYLIRPPISNEQLLRVIQLQLNQNTLNI